MQDRWADNTGMDVRQSGGFDSKNVWGPTSVAEEAMMGGHLRTMGNPGPAPIKALQPDMDAAAEAETP